MSPETAPLGLFGKWTSTIPNPPAGIPAPSKVSLSFEQHEDGIHYTADSEFPDGKKVHAHAVLQFDGQFYPLTGSPFGDAISVRQTGPASFESQVTKAGAPSARAAVTATDNRLTAHWEAHTPNGIVSWTSEAVRQTS
ncbi:hypothetical protein SBA6_930024 [Candidatus Sulfopaludibacter sp. SbA6]|nr:hypothetical protein SBA6_930024 [Candidatus Sulfopaludibacter sp. SbA6]